MHVSRYVRSGGALGHLLLVVVLALGIFVMHTTGHPDGASGAATGASPHAPATTAHTDDSTTSPQAVTVSSHSSASAQDIKASSHSPAMGMDMASLCVAVLSTWILAGLLRAAVSRGTDWLVRLRDGAAGVLRPDPPPHRPPDLARLSVLRI
ncbi:hypothetical protein [Streptomyces milbemycinicus]|uniref:Uncharacterized protein n=1 Tax=Streptomyces milbemycinicus TaxID=476552 RepID=A0ABW8LRX6_9ACTN|nr:DUF6153 family protein [Streptomyces sp. FXJ1.4098]